MRNSPIYEEFSQDRKEKFEIYQLKNRHFDIYLQYYDIERDGYYDSLDVRHIADTLENAKIIGNSLFNRSTGF